MNGQSRSAAKRALRAQAKALEPKSEVESLPPKEKPHKPSQAELDAIIAHALGHTLVGRAATILITGES